MLKTLPKALGDTFKNMSTRALFQSSFTGISASLFIKENTAGWM